MGDIYNEQIVKKQASMKSTLTRVGIILSVVVIFFVCLSIPVIQTFAIIIAAAAAFGAYYLISMLNIEYEYIFTNGELDIDAIYSKSRRKRVFTGTVKDFDIVAHVSDAAHTRDFGGATETKDYSSGVVGNNTYAFLASYKGKRLKIIFEPNEKMIKAFSSVLTPRKFFKKL
ncbi:MAG: DUF6106 family protein [Clostridiales bacterium]|jgi:hypothetical protein|nr:DUF6106 family protein [Clostridiales bacterium]